MITYEEGQPIPAQGDFVASDGGLVDPTTIYFAYQAPGQTTETVLSVVGGGLTVSYPSQYVTRASVTLPTYGYPGAWVGEWYVLRGGQHVAAKPWGALVSERKLDLPTTVPDPLPTDNTSGNPWHPYTVTTTDATPTRLVRIPIAASSAIITAGGVWVLRTTDGLNALLQGGGLCRRVGSAAPAWDLTPSGAVGAGYGDGTWSATWTETGLAGISAAWVLNADSIDLMVTGLGGSTIRWTLFGAPAWTYL